MLYLLALGFSPRRLEGHSDGTQECSCAQHEPLHPFTIDCTDVATINAASALLDGACKEPNAYEWGGTFATPDSSYKWVAQAVDGEDGLAYADPTMKLVVFAVDSTDKADLLAHATPAATLMEGTCTVVTTGGSIPTPDADGACYLLTFPAPDTDFEVTVATNGVGAVAFYGEHVPTEFERDTHYFMSTDLETDIEPVAETDAEEYNCRSHAATSGIYECAQAFYIIQAHHDYCPHDTLTRYEEELFHEWESKCQGCSIVREYDSTLNDCPVIDCTDTTVAELGYSYLHEHCTPADTTYAFEWAAVFDTPADEYEWVAQAASVEQPDYEWAGAFATPDNSYNWVAQPATKISGAGGGYHYVDPAMKLVVFAMDGTAESDMTAKAAEAAILMNGTCTTVSTGGSIPAPTASGACYSLEFPDNGDPTDTPADFSATVDTTGVANVGFFAEHVPTEFERDTHYFMSADMVTDIEPIVQTPWTCIMGDPVAPCVYADETMKLVVYAMPDNLKATLYAKKDDADEQMAGTCTVVSTGGAIPVPTTSGACYMLTYPTAAGPPDFTATVDTTGVAHVAFFAEHVPTEFERDTHYFMSADMETDIEPVNTLGDAAAHDHGRRLSQANFADRRSSRRLASPGSCCNTDMEIGGWKQVVAYHDLCDYSQVPEYIEIGFHDYEASCEDHFCNLIGPGIDQTVCPYPPPSPPSSPPASSDDDMSAGAIAGIAVAVAVAVLAILFICAMVFREKAGKPLFTNLDATPPSKSSTVA